MNHLDPQYLKKVEDLARKLAIKHAQAIVKDANAQSEVAPGHLAGAAASMTFQNIIVSLAVQVYAPGSPEGAAFLNQCLHESLKDALLRWKKPDLKAMDPGSKLS